MDHETPVFWPPENVTVNCFDCPGARVAEEGLSCMPSPLPPEGTREMMAVAVKEGLDTLVAVTVTVCGVAI
jgi:hypothetical protein